MAESLYYLGGGTLVNTATALGQNEPKIVGLQGGGYVVVWTDAAGEDGTGANSAVRGQVYDALGQRVGTEFLVNTTTPGNQKDPDVAALDSGGFLVTWTDTSATGGDTSGTAIRAQ